MKRIEHEVERTGDKITIKALWRDKFKRPGNVTIQMENNGNHDTPMLRPLLSGDVVDVRNTLHGIAQIAWDQGWRPAGLGATLAAVVERFKEPKAE